MQSFFVLNSSEEEAFDLFGYRTELRRLYEGRLAEVKRLEGLKPHYIEDKESFGKEARLLLFQLMVDYQYNLLLHVPIDLDNKTIVLNTTKADGWGDIAQTFLSAEKIKNKLKNCAIKIAIDHMRQNELEKLKKIFPADRFTIQLYSSDDYFKKEKEIIANRDNSGCILGIAVPVTGPELRHSQYRSLREYGFCNHPDVKEERLGMGFTIQEEGLLFPPKVSRQLYAIKTPWLKNVWPIQFVENEIEYQQNHKLYHMYMPDWKMQIKGLYCIALMEKDSPQMMLDIIMGQDYKLNDLIQWGALQPDFLRNNNIGKLMCITPAGEEVVELGPGKIMRIYNGPIVKEDMEAIEEHSERFFGCTGDVSMSGGVVEDKTLFYSDTGLKGEVVKGFIAVSEEQNLPHLATFQKAVARQYAEESAIYRKYIPRKISYYQTDPSFDLAKADSIPRLAMKEISPLLTRYAEEIVAAYLQPDLQKETDQFNNVLLNHYNAEPRLIAMACRGLLFKQFPDLVHIEEDLWQRFNRREIGEEEVVKQMHQHIKFFLNHSPQPMQIDQRKAA